MPKRDWPTLLREISERLFDSSDEDARQLTWLRAARGDREREAIESQTRSASRWLGFPGATEAEITAREQELGVRFPREYRAFLRASNGFLTLSGFPFGMCTLSPVQKVGWFRDLDRVGRLEAYQRELAEAEPDVLFAVLYEEFERMLLIGDSDGNECILFLPPGPDNGWELWTYDPEAGFSGGLSFRKFMERGLGDA